MGVNIFKNKAAIQVTLILFINLLFNFFFRVNEYYLKFFDPQYISLPALLSSIQYHTGLVVKLDIRDSTKFSNKDIINHDFSEDSIVEIKPIVQSFNFRNFIINKNNDSIFRNKYETLYDPGIQRVFFNDLLY